MLCSKFDPNLTNKKSSMVNSNLKLKGRKVMYGKFHPNAFKGSVELNCTGITMMTVSRYNNGYNL